MAIFFRKRWISLGATFGADLKSKKTPEPLTFVPSESYSKPLRLSWDSIENKLKSKKLIASLYPRRIRQLS
jgi:hypothetical protein